MSGAYEWRGQFVIVKSEFMYVCMYVYVFYTAWQL